MKQKFLFQMIRKDDGSRSDPFAGDWDQLHDALSKTELDQEDYILLVAIVDPDDDTQMVIPNTPLITVKSFLEIKTPEVA